MKQEWYEYAISIKKRTNNKIKKISDFMIYFVLLFISLPLLIDNIWCWLILTILYCLALLYNSQEKDDYAKALFDIGITFLILGVEISAAVSIFSNNQKYIFVFTIIGIALYEILVLAKVRFRKYSTSTVKTLKKGTGGSNLALFGVLVGCVLGHSLISNDKVSLLIFLVSVVCALFVIFSITILQKYFVYKIIKAKDSSSLYK